MRWLCNALFNRLVSRLMPVILDTLEAEIRRIAVQRLRPSSLCDLSSRWLSGRPTCKWGRLSVKFQTSQDP
jgi:hypothetical protein